MARFKNADLFTHSTDNMFDEDRDPGTLAEYSGIYRCVACSLEVTSEAGNPLPPPSHHLHTSGQGAIRWRLVVAANHKALTGLLVGDFSRERVTDRLR